MSEVLAGGTSAPGAAAHWRLLGRLENTAIGTRGADGTIAVRRSRLAGCILYGPHWQLPGGSYRLTFRCQAGAPRLASQPVLGVEVIVLNRLQQAWKDFTAGELGSGPASVEFEVPPELGLEAANEARFEFRFFHLGNADLVVSDIELASLPGQAILTDAPLWRMLGRLRKSFIGKRRADGATVVRRRERAGPVLYGGWPYLRLPRGKYRLSVRGATGMPRGSAAPVLGLEIVGRSKWRSNRPWLALPHRLNPNGVRLARRDCAGDELRDGSAFLDFDVPTEMSLEAGEDAPFEFRLFHLGNADLTVSAVELRQLRSATAAPAPPPLAASAARQSRAGERKKIVIIGNCQADIVRQGFQRSDFLSRRFEAKYHFVTLSENLYEFAKRDLDACDILLVHDIREWDDFPLRSIVREDIETISFPVLRFASLWPFDAWNGPDDKEARTREAPNLVFPYLDGLLARLRREIPDNEERFRAYRALACEGIISNTRFHDREKRRLLAIDKKFGLAIGAFVLENFQRRRIFHTTMRPSREILDMLMKYVLERIGIGGAHPLPKSLDNLLMNPQVPVHPKVARDLAVRWANESTKYLDHGREITWETYVRSYIDHYG